MTVDELLAEFDGLQITGGREGFVLADAERRVVMGKSILECAERYSEIRANERSEVRWIEEALTVFRRSLPRDWVGPLRALKQELWEVAEKRVEVDELDKALRTLWVRWATPSVASRSWRISAYSDDEWEALAENLGENGSGRFKRPRLSDETLRFERRLAEWRSGLANDWTGNATALVDELCGWDEWTTRMVGRMLAQLRYLDGSGVEGSRDEWRVTPFS